MQYPVQMNRRVRDVLSLIALRFCEPWTLAMLADHVNVSAAHLTRLFITDTGTTPMAALKVRRMEEAAKLLCTTHLSVKQIAFDVGFADVSHFVRDFGELYGKRPANYRKTSEINNGQ